MFSVAFNDFRCIFWPLYAYNALRNRSPPLHCIMTIFSPIKVPVIGRYWPLTTGIRVLICPHRQVRVSDADSVQEGRPAGPPSPPPAARIRNCCLRTYRSSVGCRAFSSLVGRSVAPANYHTWERINAGTVCQDVIQWRASRRDNSSTRSDNATLARERVLMSNRAAINKSCFYNYALNNYQDTQ